MFSPDRNGFGNLSQGRGCEHEAREIIKEKDKMKSLSSKEHVHSPPAPTFLYHLWPCWTTYPPELGPHLTPCL